MKLFLSALTGFLALGFVILNGVGFFSLYALGKSNFYKPGFVRNGVTESEFDYVILGSSNGLTTLDSRIIDSITGKKGLNISMDDSGLSSQFLMLQHFYASGKSTKCLILAISYWDLAVTNPGLSGNDYRFLPYVSERYVTDYYRELEPGIFKTLTFSRYIPLIGVSSYNTKLFYPSVLATIIPSMKNRFDDKGNYSYPVSIGIQKDPEFKTVQVEFRNRYFLKLKQFCSDNEIRLVLYQGPLYKTQVTLGATKNVVNHSTLLTDKAQFYDAIHVNRIGRRICSEELAKYLLHTDFATAGKMMTQSKLANL